MKLFKLIGTMTIVAAVAAAMAVSASAATATYTADGTVGTVTVDGVGAAAENTEYTAVVTNVTEGLDLAAGDYLQMEQAADISTLKVDAADMTAGKYYVRVGGVANTDTYVTIPFAVTQEDAVTKSDIENASTEDAPVAWYVTQVQNVPTGLTPYWVNKDNARVQAMTAANIESGVKLALKAQYEGVELDEAMKLVWDLAK